MAHKAKEGRCGLVGRSFCIKALDQDAGMRLDTFLAEKAAYPSRSAAAKAIEAGSVFVNAKQTNKRHTIEVDDVIVYERDDEENLCPLQGEPIELDIRYEDDDLIVLSKQPGLICHPVNEYREHTLVGALIYRYGAEGLCNVQGEFDRPGIVHRLDRDTSGLMLAAKTDEAGTALMEAISLREIDRRYLALVHGKVSSKTGLIDAPIERNPQNRTTMRVGSGPSAREAITTFKVVHYIPGTGTNDGYTLLECKLYTGRTHQIRTHMQYIKHPIVGDPVYNAHGPKDAQSQLCLTRQFLHSYRLGFDHPMTGEHMEFTDMLPADLNEAYLKIEPEGFRKVEDYHD